MKRASFILLCSALFLFPAQQANAQVIYTFGTYSQNFDTLASSGTNNPWVDNSTITGWYSTRTSYRAGDGSGNSADLYSYGGGSINPITERALGSITSNSITTIQYGVQILNNTNETFTNFNLAFVGEQWRNSGGNNQTTLTFDYLITPLSTNQLTAGGYTPHTALNFNALHFTSPATALDGNDPANQTALNSTITGISWAPGEYLWLRWTDIKPAGNPDNGLAIDGLSFAAAVPEPGTILMVTLLILGIGSYRTLRAKNAAKTPATPASDSVETPAETCELPALVTAAV